MAMSAVDIMIGTRFDGSSGSGAMSSFFRPFGRHWLAPAGLLVSSHS